MHSQSHIANAYRYQLIICFYIKKNPLSDKTENKALLIKKTQKCFGRINKNLKSSVAEKVLNSKITEYTTYNKKLRMN